MSTATVLINAEASIQKQFWSVVYYFLQRAEVAFGIYVRSQHDSRIQA